MWHAGGFGAYLEVDLGAAKTVKQVKFWNRDGCCQDRAVGAYITLFDVNMNIVTGNSAVLTSALVQSFYFVTRPADNIIPSPWQLRIGSPARSQARSRSRSDPAVPGH